MYTNRLLVLKLTISLVNAHAEKITLAVKCSWHGVRIIFSTSLSFIENHGDSLAEYLVSFVYKDCEEIPQT